MQDQKIRTVFRVYTTLGTKYVEADNAADARAMAKKRFPQALITKVKPMRGGAA